MTDKVVINGVEYVPKPVVLVKEGNGGVYLVTPTGVCLSTNDESIWFPDANHVIAFYKSSSGQDVEVREWKPPAPPEPEWVYGVWEGVVDPRSGNRCTYKIPRGVFEFHILNPSQIINEYLLCNYNGVLADGIPDSPPIFGVRKLTGEDRIPYPFNIGDYGAFYMGKRIKGACRRKAEHVLRAVISMLKRKIPVETRFCTLDDLETYNDD